MLLRFLSRLVAELISIRYCTLAALHFKVRLAQIYLHDGMQLGTLDHTRSNLQEAEKWYRQARVEPRMRSYLPSAVNRVRSCKAIVARVQ